MNHDHSQSENVTDPVCGMSIPPAKPELRSDHHGVTYHFCSDSCKQTFEADPGKYAHSHDQGHQHH